MTEKLYLHVKEGDLQNRTANIKLVPARFIMYGLDFISGVVLIVTMSAILNSDRIDVKKKNSYHLMKDYENHRPA